jgi:hypothetical protein
MIFEKSDLSPEWRLANSFSYKWPAYSSEKHSTAPERYTKAYETEIDLPSGRYNIKIGYTTRKAFGIDNRLRITVFITIGNLFTPAVEFVGTDDFMETYKVASVIKTKKGHQVHSADQLPAEYKEMRIATYSDVVRGPYASHGLAVVADVNDRNTMLRHALIRAYYKGWIKD